VSLGAALGVGLWLVGGALGLAHPPSLGAAEQEGTLQVLGAEGTLRLYRFETEAWPLEEGSPLPDNSRVELDAGAKLRLRYSNFLDFDLAGPARLTVYVMPSPSGGEFDDDRVILKMDEGVLLVDGRFQFGRSADVVLSLPDLSIPLPADSRFFARAGKGSSGFYLPVDDDGTAAEAALSGSAMVALQPQRLAPSGTLPESLFSELTRPVKLFVVARDFDQDLGEWPRPAVLGPLLTERMADIAGIQVVDGSGDTYFAYQANGALKGGQDFFLKEMALAQGARWVLVGNCVTDTPPQESAPILRHVRGQAEVRLLEADGEAEGLELVSEAAVTRVARAGRPMEQASRQAMEAAADEVSNYLKWQIENLLKGHAHADVLLKLQADNMDEDAMEALRARLASMDSVQRVFRRSFSKKVAVFDLMLRRDAADFDAQWAAAKGGAWSFESLPAPDPLTRCVRALKAP
jgi:hypothetical protein